MMIERVSVLELPALVPQLSRYAVVSGAALALDVALYLTLVAAGVVAGVAAVCGYLAGMIVHYGLSTQFVFETSGLDKSQARTFTEFVASGLAGLAMTACVVSTATHVFGWHAVTAKIFAVSASFFAVFLLRKCMVFARRRT